MMVKSSHCMPTCMSPSKLEKQDVFDWHVPQGTRGRRVSPSVASTGPSRDRGTYDELTAAH